MSNSLAKIFATFFYIGFMPFAPGTTASMAGMLVYFLLYRHMALYILAFVVLTLVGFLTAGRVEKNLNRKDPPCVVIDEVAGVMIALFMLPMTPSVIMTAFFLFRAFDMFKIYPANKLQALTGSLGIMMDDVVAGVYTNATMLLALKMKSLMIL